MTGKPNPIDIRVGARLRLRRNMRGLSQQKLGQALGLTFQQVQKYERGANKITASRLHELSQLLDVPISFFFDDTDPVRAPAMGSFAEPPAKVVSDPVREQEATELIQAYFSIKGTEVRRCLLDLTKTLAASIDPRRSAEMKRAARPDANPTANLPGASTTKRRRSTNNAGGRSQNRRMPQPQHSPFLHCCKVVFMVGHGSGIEGRCRHARRNCRQDHARLPMRALSRVAERASSKNSGPT